MLTVKEALDLNLEVALKKELAQFPGDYIVLISQDNNLFVAPPSDQALNLCRAQDRLLETEWHRDFSYAPS